MHARHRSSGDGVRSSSVGMYNSDYRSFNRGGFGRCPPKAYPPPPPPPPPPLPPRRVGDIFMEAGRLAAEYLVSQGLLPPSSLPGKWQNGSLQEFRLQDREPPPLPPEGRHLPFGRFGNVAPEGGSGRRRFPDEFNSIAPRSRMRGRRRNEHPIGYGSDWSRENGRSGPWVEQTRGFPDMVESEDDFAGGYYRDIKFGFDVGGGPLKAVASEQHSKDEMDYDSDELETYEFPNDSGSKASSSSTLKDNRETDGNSNKGPNDAGSKASSSSTLKEHQDTDANSNKGPNNASKAHSSSTLKEISQETVANSNKGPNDAIAISLDTVEVKDTKRGEDMEKAPVQENLDKQNSVGDDPVNKHGVGLLQLCNFTKVPTKTRSSLTSRALRVDQGAATEMRSACEVSHATYETPEEEDSIDRSKSDSLTNPIHIPKSLPPDFSLVPSAQSVDEAGKLETSSVMDREVSPRPKSILNTSFMDQEESSDVPPGFDMCRPVVASNENLPGFDKCRPVTASKEDEGSPQRESAREGTKRPREWPPSPALQDDEYCLLHNSRSKQPRAEFDKIPPDVVMVEDDQEIMAESASSPEARAESGIESREEKQLPPNSFKICDLNLTDVSEITENPHDVTRDDVSADVSALGVVKEASAEAGLSITSKLKNTGNYDGCSSDAKEIAVIDVPDDPVMEDKVFASSEQKTETIYSSIESFLNHTEHSVDLPHVQDGYGQAISEFLGTDIANCSSVPTGITDLQAEMTLHNQEGILADDDQLFLTLGEIPMSFLGVWDQPPQEYGKPF